MSAVRVRHRPPSVFLQSPVFTGLFAFLEPNNPSPTHLPRPLIPLWNSLRSPHPSRRWSEHEPFRPPSNLHQLARSSGLCQHAALTKRALIKTAELQDMTKVAKELGVMVEQEFEE